MSVEEEITRLKQNLNSFKKVSVEKIDTMNRLASLLLQKNLKEADDISHRSVIEARNIAYAKGEAEALMQAGMYAYAQRQFADASGFYNQSLSIFEKEGNEEEAAKVLAKLGNLNLQEGNYADALSYYNRAIAIRTRLKDELGTADLYSNSGIIHGFQGNYSLALKSHLQALKTYEALSQTSRIASSSINIGLIYSEQQNYDDALKMFQRALEIREAEKNSNAVSDILNNIGNVYHEQKKYSEAIEVHLRTLHLRETVGDKIKIASSYGNLGIVYKSLREYEKAMDYFSRALFLFKETNEKRRLAQLYNDFGRLYFDLQDYAKAHEFLRLAIQLSDETGLKNLLVKSYEYLSEVFSAEKNFEEAYRAHVQFTRLNNEVLSMETNRQIAQINMRHEIEQNEKVAETERIKNAELKKAYDSLEYEKKRSDELLHNILPEKVADELKEKGSAKARLFENVTVLFTDFKGFTTVSEKLSPQDLVNELDECFKAFDEIVSKYNIEKIKTVGDAYLAAGGLPVTNQAHATDILKAAVDIRNFMLNRKAEFSGMGRETFEIRIGVHSGHVVAGIVGAKKFAYDIWGDTVNTAARMEQNSEAGKINISESTYQLVRHQFNCLYRGEIEAKNKGKLKMYFVE